MPKILCHFKKYIKYNFLRQNISKLNINNKESCY